MPAVYRLENAKTGRSGCTNKECKDNQIKIEKGELRFATQVEIQEHLTWKYKHWGCVTPQVIGNLKEAIENNLEYLDGYDEIDEESQAKVRTALEVGHVADEDWKGDVERNRPGQKGFRSPAAVKKKQKMAEENENGSPTPSKPKKRGRGKKEEDDDQNVKEPPAKKSKATQKRSKKQLAEEQGENADLGASSDPEPPKKARGGKKTAAKVKAEDQYFKHESGEEDGDPDASTVAADVSRKATTSKKIKHEVTEPNHLSESSLQAPGLVSEATYEPNDIVARSASPTSKGRKGTKKAHATQDGGEHDGSKTKPQTRRVTRSQGF